MLQGDLVCVFPEGTTTDGTRVLPFHANLMQAPISGGLPVQPVGLAYLDAATGQPTTAPAYIGDLTLLQTLDAILRAPPITARLAIAPILHCSSASRRELAESAREVVMHLCRGEHDEAKSSARQANRASALQGSAGVNPAPVDPLSAPATSSSAIVP